MSSVKIVCGLMVLGGLLVLKAGSAAAQSGLQITPDQRRTLISKDVGADRWAISYNHDDGSATGNIFTEGLEPRFVWCSNDFPGSDPVQLDCFLAARCNVAPCTASEWQSIGTVEIPASFFLPRATAAGASDQVGAQGGVETERQSGVQISPDARRALISKDINGQRWAITVNLEDRTVTGNVFLPGGGADPRFVWCEQTGIVAGSVELSCRGANKCETTSCSPDQWSFLADVALPDTFFRAATFDDDPRASCIAAARAGDMVSASISCIAAVARDPNDGTAALILAVADPVARAFESVAVLGHLAALGIQIRGSAFNVCAIRSTFPSNLPTDSTEGLRGGEIQVDVASEILRITDLARTRLDGIPIGNGLAYFISDLPDCLRILNAPSVDVDATDLTGVRSVIELLASGAQLGSAYDVDFDVGIAADLGLSFGEIFQTTPGAFVLLPEGSAKLGRARTALDASLEAFVEAIDMARAEGDDQGDDVLVISSSDADEVEEARAGAQELRTALAGEGTFDTVRFSSLETTQRLRLNAVFAGQVANLRGFFPVQPTGEFTPCQFPDATFGGRAPDTSQDDLNDLLDLDCFLDEAIGGRATRR